ncbi:hypothetical protein F4780DRAFT_757816 [Xylariomycetidae sp. FL0641]|nr:hypothetical protein F4780DRAFT_757816 [Xylariomycetidae sp. FL0641]
MDEFWDDDIDSLEPNALQELENNAILQSTQAQKKYDLDYGFEDEDLDDAVVSLQLPSRALPPQPPPTSLQPPAYGPIRPPPPLPRPAPSIPTRYQPSQAPRPNASAQELTALQAQILDLKSRLTTKDGEISIVRKRLEKSAQDHERELQALKKQSADQVSRHERALEAAKAAEVSAATELEFARRDLREEVHRAKRKETGTPNKNAPAKSWGIADGFEDVEMVGSPSRGQRGKNAGGPVARSVVEPPARLTRTPTKGKRKRTAMDSPVMALETHSEDVAASDHPACPEQASIAAPRASAVDYIKVILNHSAAHGRPLTFECLAAFAVPSRSAESIASVLFQKLASTGSPEEPMRLPIEFCEQVIELWMECHKKECLAPIPELVSLVAFTLQLHTVGVAPSIAVSLLPVAMNTCLEVAIPRYHSPGGGDPTDSKFKKSREHIDTGRILSLLYMVAAGCAASPVSPSSITASVVDFWSQVPPEFLCILLSPKQPLRDFLTMLRLLCTSVLPTSIGPISPDCTAHDMAQSVINRVSASLTEPLKWDVDREQQHDIHVAILQTLSAFARSPFGLLELATSETVIPRLVTLLSGSIDELYAGEMHYVPAEEGAAGGLQKVVTQTMMLLHMLVTNHECAASADVSGKLAKATGGSQKYLLSLARLNFAEDLVSEETAELAHELLELAVTSEEGEEIGAVFGG